MSKRLPPALSDRLYAMLSGEHLNEHLYKALLLITHDEKGWPYVAMLSFLEVIARDRENIRMAPFNNSTTSTNLRRDSKVTLILVDEELACYIQASAQELEHDLKGFPGMAKVNLRIESILEDKALDYEGSARVSSGIRFENPQMTEAYIARGRAVLQALRQ
jgi:hypothetical protein